MLLPTGFRKKPQAFVQHVDLVPMEIQFFGVSGKVVSSDEKVIDSVQVNDPSQNLNIDVHSGFDIEVEIKNKQESFTFTIDDARINQLFVADRSISA